MSFPERDSLQAADYTRAKFHSITKSGVVLVTLFHRDNDYYNIQVHWHRDTDWWGVRWANEGTGQGATRDAVAWMKAQAREGIPIKHRMANMYGTPDNRTQEFDADFPAL